MLSLIEHTHTHTDDMNTFDTGKAIDQKLTAGRVNELNQLRLVQDKRKIIQSEACIQISINRSIVAI